MKKFTYSKLAISYIFILSLIISIVTVIAIAINLFNNKTVSLVLIITFIMIFFDVCFFFFYFCFKKNKYPYLNYQWKELEIKKILKKSFVWYFVVPSITNYLLIIILLILAYAYPTTFLNWQQLLILLAIGTLLNLVNISYVFFAIKFNKNHNLEKDIDFTLRKIK